VRFGCAPRRDSRIGLLCRLARCVDARVGRRRSGRRLAGRRTIAAWKEESAHPERAWACHVRASWDGHVCSV